jgi:hypothetical protein
LPDPGAHLRGVSERTGTPGREGRRRTSGPIPEGGAGTDRYRAVEVQSRRETVLRAALWSAVALGAVGGLFSLVRSPASSSPEPAAAESSDTGELPVPVAGFAEIAVEEWLTATRENSDGLRSLYLEPVESARVEGDGLSVLRVRTVGGRVVEDDYWQVVVAADVVEFGVPTSVGAPGGGGEVDEDPEALPADNEPVEGDADGAPPEAEIRESEGEPARNRWYLEIGVVADDSGGLAAVRVPAVVEEPPEVGDGRRPSGSTVMGRPPADDPLVGLTEDFLNAWLAGEGDPSRFIVAGGELAPVDPAPFAGVVVELIGAEELAADDVRLQVQVLATTPGGSQQAFAYELYARRSVSRWEIYDFSGAPVLEAGAPGEADGLVEPSGEE